MKCDALNRAGPVTASGQYSEYAPANASDGDTGTRWAVEGPEHWIQFSLDPQRPFDRLDIQWYEGASRKYDFDILVSDNGEDWKKVSYQREVVRSRPLALDRVDVCETSVGANRAIALSYPIELARSSTLQLTIVPVTGKARICGIVLEPTDRPAPFAPEAKGDR